MSNMELRLAGSGGQGVILATVILAEAAILAGKYTAQSPGLWPGGKRRQLQSRSPDFGGAHWLYQGAEADLSDGPHAEGLRRLRP